MTRCETIARLLPDVADQSASPTEAAWVGRHVSTCTHCRIQLARERRLSRAIDEMRDVDVDPQFTAAVLARIPEPLPRRRRGRRGLKLALLGSITLLGATLGTPHGNWGTGLFSAAPPALPADVADPAGGGLIALAQTLLLAVRSFLDAPLIAAAFGSFSLPLLLVGACLVLGAMAFGSTLIVLAAGAWARTRPARAA